MKLNLATAAVFVVGGLALSAAPAHGTGTAPQGGHPTEFGYSSIGTMTVFDGDGIRKVVHRKGTKKFVEYPAYACKKSFTVRKHFKVNTENAVAVDCDGNRTSFKIP